MKYLMMLVVCFISLQSIAQVSEELLDAIRLSEKRANYPIGDKGKAYGDYQIHMKVIKDVNRYYKLNYKHEDAFDPVKARRICKLYLRMWGKIKNVKSNEGLARIWNGGPNGYKKRATLVYWRAVKRQLEVA